MKTYLNLSGQSGVRRYNYDYNSIIVEFKDGGVYEYTYTSAGQANIENMKLLADAGKGLGAFINTTVRMRYSRKIK